MTNHNLEALNSFEFESLVKSVLDRDLSLDLEIFKPGKDDGIDLRHAFTSGDTLIVQCKHRPQAIDTAVVLEFKTKELPKVRRLSPARYIVATSSKFGVAAKKNLIEAMKPFIVLPGDIYGREQIEHILDENEDIVRAHFRLWLNSNTVLAAVLSQPVSLRSRSYAEKISRQLPRFVQTGAFHRAQVLLRARRVVLLSGPPGIGKTTLADILAAELMAAGVKLVKVTKNVSEALELWSPDQPQVFMYDDFLGRSARGDFLEKNEDQDILDFAARVTAADNKYFIMTTRGYILGQAKAVYEKLGSPALGLTECVLELEDLDLQARSHILYNHVVAAGLAPKERSLFAQRTAFGPILDHKNYSPRLVEQSLELYKNGKHEGLSAPALMRRNLDNPAGLWRHAIESDLSEDGRALMDLFYTFGTSISYEQLRDAWARLHIEDVTLDRFDVALSVLEGDFLVVGGAAADPSLTSANPSLDDFMNVRLRSRPGVLIQIASDVSSVDHLRSIYRVYESVRLRASARGEMEVAMPSAVREALFERAISLSAISDESAPDLAVNVVALAMELAESEPDQVRALQALWGLASEIQTGAWTPGWEIDAEEFVSLVHIAGRLPWTHDVMRRSGLVDAAEEMLSDGIGDFLHLSSVAEQAHGNVLLEGLSSRLEESLFEWALNMLEGWDGADSPELRSALDFAGGFMDPETVFGNYGKATEMIEAKEAKRTNEAGPLPTMSASAAGWFDAEGLMADLLEP